MKPEVFQGSASDWVADWLAEEPYVQKHDSHVMLADGFDLSASGVMPWDVVIGDCRFCGPVEPEKDRGVILSSEVLKHGRRIHYVCCGGCGARGPWAATESEALRVWSDFSGVLKFFEGAQA